MRLIKLGALASLAILASCVSGQQYRLSSTGAGQALSRVTSDPGPEMGPAISPDGQTLLFDTRLARDVTVIGVDPASGTRRTVYSGTNSMSDMPAWDPQGRFFVYATNSPGSWSIVRTLANSANSAVSILISGEVAPLASDPDISPDGTKVAFATMIRLVWQIAIVNLDGSNFTLLTDGRDPSWSPDGRRLAYTRLVNGYSQIFSIDPATGTDVVQVTSGDFSSAYPDWSPDGNFIVFASNRGGTSGRRAYDIATNFVRGVFNLFVIRPNGTGLAQLTDTDGLAIQPSWGRDGWIYFTSNQAGNLDIWRLRPVVAQLEGRTPATAASASAVQLAAAAVALAPSPGPARQDAPPAVAATTASLQMMWVGRAGGSGFYAALAETSDHQGVQVLGVATGSIAATAGLQGGDIIIAVAGQTVNSVAEATARVGGLGNDAPIVLSVLRGRGLVTVTIRRQGS